MNFRCLVAIAAFIPSLAFASSPVLPTQERARALVETAGRLDFDVAERAIQALYCAEAQGSSIDKLIVVDMALDARQKRLWAFDLKDREKPRLVVNHLVSHGSGSDPDGDGKAQRFSNTPHSNMTSLGLFKVAERYAGKHGWSRRLDGLLGRFNDRARERAVVLHAAPYVTPVRAGRSQGCPAVAPDILAELERSGLSDTVLWVDGPDPQLGDEVSKCAAKGRERALAVVSRRAGATA